jgi:CheY-like chemotaxis protein
MTDRKQLGDLLVEAGIITIKTLERALERQKGSGKRLGMVFEEMGVITEEELAEALAKQFGFKTARNIASHAFPPDLLYLIPEDFAVQKLVFPLRQKDGVLAVAITDPFDSDTFDYLAKLTGMKIMPVLAGRAEILEAIRKNYFKSAKLLEGKLKILVVEDSPSVAAIIQVALQKTGYEVIVGHDGIEGLKLAVANVPDLIICDLVMPRMDAYGLKRALQAEPATAQIPIILITAKGSGEEEEKALDSGFLDFIPKPIQPIRIISRVRRAFELMKSMQKAVAGR